MGIPSTETALPVNKFCGYVFSEENVRSSADVASLVEKHQSSYAWHPRSGSKPVQNRQQRLTPKIDNEASLCLHTRNKALIRPFVHDREIHFQELHGETWWYPGSQFSAARVLLAIVFRSVCLYRLRSPELRWCMMSLLADQVNASSWSRIIPWWPNVPAYWQSPIDLDWDGCVTMLWAKCGYETMLWYLYDDVHVLVGDEIDGIHRCKILRLMR